MCLSLVLIVFLNEGDVVNNRMRTEHNYASLFNTFIQDERMSEKHLEKSKIWIRPRL